MRTTVTLDADVEVLLERAMKQKGVSFKEALNAALRLGLMKSVAKPTTPAPLPVFDLGARGSGDLDKASLLAATLEDDALVRKLDQGK